MVMVLSTVMAAVYSVDAVVGVDPSVVYRIVAPEVVVLNVTVLFALYVPPSGAKTTPSPVSYRQPTRPRSWSSWGERRRP